MTEKDRHFNKLRYDNKYHALITSNNTTKTFSNLYRFLSIMALPQSHMQNKICK